MERESPRIVLNVAAAADMEKLPGIGPALAKAIVQRRQEVGPYSRLDELTEIRGIGPHLIEKIRALVVLDEDAEITEGGMLPVGDLYDRSERFLPKTASEEDHEPMGTGIESRAGMAEPASTSGQEEEDPISDLSEKSESASWDERFMEENQEDEARAGLITEARDEGGQEEPEEPEVETPLTGAEHISDAGMDREEPQLGESPDSTEAAEMPRRETEPQARPGAPAPSSSEKTGDEAFRHQPPLQLVERKGVPFWTALLLILMGALLGAGSSLGVLWLNNGTMQFGSRGQLNELQVQVMQLRSERDSLTAQMDILNKENERIRRDLTAIPQIESDLGQTKAGLQDAESALGTLKLAMETTRGDVDAVTANVGVLEKQTNELVTELAEAVAELERVAGELKVLQQSAARFDSFLTGLRELLQNVLIE